MMAIWLTQFSVQNVDIEASGLYGKFKSSMHDFIVQFESLFMKNAHFDHMDFKHMLQSTFILICMPIFSVIFTVS